MQESLPEDWARAASSTRRPAAVAAPTGSERTRSNSEGSDKHRQLRRQLADHNSCNCDDGRNLFYNFVTIDDEVQFLCEQTPDHNSCNCDDGRNLFYNFVTID